MKIKKLLFCSIAAPLFLFSHLAIAGKNASEKDVWPMYQGNSAHTGYVPLEFDPKSFHKGYTTVLKDDCAAYYHFAVNSPIAVQGMVFVTAGTPAPTHEMSLFAIDAKTGKIRWQVKKKDMEALSGPLYWDGKLYVQSCDLQYNDNLVSYDIMSGKEISSRDLNSIATPRFKGVHYMTGTPYDDSLYVQGSNGVTNFEINTSYASFLDTISMGYFERSTPAVGDKVVVNYNHQKNVEKNIFITNRTGYPKAFVSVTIPHSSIFSNIDNVPVLDEEKNLVFSLIDGYLSSYAYDGRTWKVKYSVGPDFAENAQPVLANDVIYAVKKTGSLVAIDEDTGKEKWEWSPSDIELDGKSIIATKNLIFVSSDHETFAVDIQAHKSVWSIMKKGKLAIDQDNLYILEEGFEAIALAQIRLTND